MKALAHRRPRSWKRPTIPKGNCSGGRGQSLENTNKKSRYEYSDQGKRPFRLL